MQNIKGFSLLEILITMAMVSVLGAVVLPKYQKPSCAKQNYIGLCQPASRHSPGGYVPNPKQRNQKNHPS